LQKMPKSRQIVASNAKRERVVVEMGVCQERNYGLQGGTRRRDGVMARGREIGVATEKIVVAGKEERGCVPKPHYRLPRVTRRRDRVATRGREMAVATRKIVVAGTEKRE
jgi:hypothetical protein